MSRSVYNSDNTEILAMHTVQNAYHPNTKMLLLHKFESGRKEYVVGSYFQCVPYDGALGYECMDYSWDWGHYFAEDHFLEAVHYWEREVLGIADESEQG